MIFSNNRFTTRMCPFTTLLYTYVYLHVNDLMEVLRQEEIGLRVDNLIIPGLMFADALVITAENLQI